MATASPRHFRSILTSSGLAAGCCALALGAGVMLLKDRPAVAASSQIMRSDSDHDGLSDLQELVLGTLPNAADTDLDGFSDLEERARGSDPLDFTSVPQGDHFNLAISASQDAGRVSILWTAYVEAARVGMVDLEIGAVLNGHLFRFSPRDYRFSDGFLRRGSAGSRLVNVEFEVPPVLMRRLGQLNLYGVLRDRDPASTEDPAVYVYTIKDIGGVAVSVETLPMLTTTGGATGRQGVVFRPLTSQNQIPTDWNSGQICFQQTAVVGMTGASIVHDVEAADCLSMDTFCNPTACSGSVGGVLQLPDPGAILGG